MIQSLEFALLYRHCHYAQLVKAFLEMQHSGQIAVSPYLHLESVKLLITAKRSQHEGRTTALNESKGSDAFEG